MQKRRNRLILGGSVVCIGITVYLIWNYQSAQHTRTTSETRPALLTYYIEPGIPDHGQLVTQLAKQHNLEVKLVNREEADLLVTKSAVSHISQTAHETVTGLPSNLGSPEIITTSAVGNRFVTATQPTSIRGSSTTAQLASELAKQISSADSSPLWTLKAVGDIIIGREVYMKMLQYGPIHPFKNFATSLASADFTTADVENAFSDRHAVISHTGMTFVSPTTGATGLASAGIDAVSLANNHAYNGGAEGYLDTIATLDAQQIAHFGGGANLAQARTPLIYTVKGVKVALLGYAAIPGSTAATATTPGMNYLTMAPWGNLDQSQLISMESDIRQAATIADTVMVYYHWGAEYTHSANADQQTVAHRAVDAGADLVIGTHPHWVQGIEWYHDRLITYSLGNFIFDQEWATKTKQGVILNATFQGANLIQAQLEPYTIHDYNQPAPANQEVASQILRDIYDHSWWK